MKKISIIAEDGSIERMLTFTRDEQGKILQVTENSDVYIYNYEVKDGRIVSIKEVNKVDNSDYGETAATAGRRIAPILIMAKRLSPGMGKTSRKWFTTILMKLRHIPIPTVLARWKRDTPSNKRANYLVVVVRNIIHLKK